MLAASFTTKPIAAHVQLVPIAQTYLSPALLAPRGAFHHALAPPFARRAPKAPTLALRAPRQTAHAGPANTVSTLWTLEATRYRSAPPTCAPLTASPKPVSSRRPLRTASPSSAPRPLKRVPAAAWAARRSPMAPVTPPAQLAPPTARALASCPSRSSLQRRSWRGRRLRVASLLLCSRGALAPPLRKRGC